MRKKNILIFFIIFISLPLSKAFSIEQEKSGRVSIGGHGRTLSVISAEIKQKTGYTIFVDRSLADIKVNGSYQSVELEQFLRRVLKHQNYVLEWNKKKKIVYVKGYGIQGKRAGLRVERDNARQTSLNGKTNINFLKEGIDPVSGLPLDELQHKYEAAKNEGKAMYEDKGVDPVSGLPLGELQHKYEVAKNEEKAMYEDRGIDPVSSLPVHELNAKYVAAMNKSKAMYEDKGIDPVSGLPLDELQHKHETARNEGKTMYEDRDIDPVTGLPLK